MAEAPTKVPEKEYTSSELLSSAKLVAEAAQSSLRNESDKVDKAKVADAAGDLLDAATQYAKLDEQKGVGQYADKAADYLHHYKGDQGATAPPSKPTTTAPSESDPPKQESHGDDAPKSEGGGGFGQFTKLAGDFFGKK